MCNVLVGVAIQPRERAVVSKEAVQLVRTEGQSRLQQRLLLCLHVETTPPLWMLRGIVTCSASKGREQAGGEQAVENESNANYSHNCFVLGQASLCVYLLPFSCSREQLTVNKATVFAFMPLCQPCVSCYAEWGNLRSLQYKLAYMLQNSPVRVNWLVSPTTIYLFSRNFSRPSVLRINAIIWQVRRITIPVALSLIKVVAFWLWRDAWYVFVPSVKVWNASATRFLLSIGIVSKSASLWPLTEGFERGGK